MLVRVSMLWVFLNAFSVLGATANFDTAKIDEITGLKGAWNEEEHVFKIMSPRKDIPVAVDGWTMPPFMGLTSWAAFVESPQKGVMVMGDLVLFEDEINPVMSAVLDRGLGVTALHNHFVFEKPRVFFMHIGGEGHVEEMAAAVKAAFDKVKEIRAANPEPAASFHFAALPETNSITAQSLIDLLGVKGTAKDGMFKAVFGRNVKMDCGCEVGKEMGVNTWASFAGSDDNAIVDGDFAMLETEVQPVLKSLRASSINVVAIHHHMIGESPRIVFLHYWGRGKALDLAKAVKSALELTAKK